MRCFRCIRYRYRRPRKPARKAARLSTAGESDWHKIGSELVMGLGWL